MSSEAEIKNVVVENSNQSEDRKILTFIKEMIFMVIPILLGVVAYNVQMTISNSKVIAQIEAREYNQRDANADRENNHETLEKIRSSIHLIEQKIPNQGYIEKEFKRVNDDVRDLKSVILSKNKQ